MSKSVAVHGWLNSQCSVRSTTTQRSTYIHKAKHNIRDNILWEIESA